MIHGFSNLYRMQSDYKIMEEDPGYDKLSRVFKSDIEFEEELEKNEVFLNYFNTFLSLPVFGVKITYNEKKRLFDIEIATIQKKSLNFRHRQILTWIRNYRAPLFLKATIYNEYKLCYLLADSPVVAKQDFISHEDFVIFQRNQLNKVSSIQRFKQYLAGSVGENLIEFWLDAERYRWQTLEKNRVFFIKEIEEKFINQYSLSKLIPDLKDVMKKQLNQIFDLSNKVNLPIKSTLFVPLQEHVLECIQKYWIPKYILHCFLARKAVLSKWRKGKIKKNSNILSVINKFKEIKERKDNLNTRVLQEPPKLVLSDKLSHHKKLSLHDTEFSRQLNITADENLKVMNFKDDRNESSKIFEEHLRLPTITLKQNGRKITNSSCEAFIYCADSMKSCNILKDERIPLIKRLETTSMTMLAKLICTPPINNMALPTFSGSFVYKSKQMEMQNSVLTHKYMEWKTSSLKFDTNAISHDTNIQEQQPQEILLVKPRKPRSFHEILTDSFQLDFFKQYLTKEKEETPLLFWIAVESMRTKSKDAMIRQGKTQAIVKRFFGSANQGKDLNCNAEVISQIPLADKVTPAMLISAQACVAKSLEESWYSSYLATFSKDDETDINIPVYNKHGISGKFQSLREKTLVYWRMFVRNITVFTRGISNKNTFRMFRDFLKLQYLMSGSSVGDTNNFALDKISSSVIVINHKHVFIEKLVADLYFYCEVQKYRDFSDAVVECAKLGNYSKDDELVVVKKAYAIIDCFVNSLVAPTLQINISREQAETIMTLAANGIIERGLFHDATLSIFTSLFYFWKKFCTFRFVLPNLILPKEKTQRNDRSAKIALKQEALKLNKFKKVSLPEDEDCSKIMFSLQFGLRIARVREGKRAKSDKKLFGVN
ncbi:uncharacterized protein LOC100213207 isoform X13 [Hydra vulgaris]|uniref:Uncharacterized protein LOC100213207 isoform X13 n=1 Tax=Hydra vulgaris TaxID=6087 RepID=A0ABM4B6V3_HYDVU